MKKKEISIKAIANGEGIPHRPKSDDIESGSSLDLNKTQDKKEGIKAVRYKTGVRCHMKFGKEESIHFRKSPTYGGKQKSLAEFREKINKNHFCQNDRNNDSNSD